MRIKEHATLSLAQTSLEMRNKQLHGRVENIRDKHVEALC
jgi:hypothetical protein